MNSGLWKPDGAKGECGKEVDVNDLIRIERVPSLKTRSTVENVPIEIAFVIGGRESPIGEFPDAFLRFPWMTLLGYNPPQISGNEIYYVCGGSVINKHYVLTAAHCIDTENGFPV